VIRDCPLVFKPMHQGSQMTAAAKTFETHNIRRRAQSAPDPNAFAYRIAEVQVMGGPCRTKVYELGKSGKLRLIKVAGRTLVAGDSLRALLQVGADVVTREMPSDGLASQPAATGRAPAMEAGNE
jgi:hypothetical protein